MVWVIGRFNYREYLFMSTITTNLERAILDLHNGKPVAIPTETVYGLAAMIDKPEAIKAVFVVVVNGKLIKIFLVVWSITKKLKKRILTMSNIVGLFGSASHVLKKSLNNVNEKLL